MDDVLLMADDPAMAGGQGGDAEEDEAAGNPAAGVVQDGTGTTWHGSSQWVLGVVGALAAHCGQCWRELQGGCTQEAT